MTRGLLIVISGPGGVGKDTLIERLRERNPALRYSVSYTTRPRRPYEVHDEHYTFVAPEEFQRLVDRGDLLEHAVVGGHLYGTSAARVAELQAAGHDVILKIDVQGADQVRARRPDGVFVFLAPPSMDELFRRRVERGTETPEVLQARQRLAVWEMTFAGHYDHVVVNDDLERAVREVEALLEGERAGRVR
ncbi:MAG: guanylate kinase [Candidatus Dormibacteraceae bacterium]